MAMHLLSLAQRLPNCWIRFFGRLQFKVPLLRGLISRVGAEIAAVEGHIGSGEGCGLRFRAQGGYPGYLLGSSEPEEQRLLAGLLSGGKVFYDIGANIGFYSTLAGRMVGPSGYVFAFEPFGQSAAACRHNASLNGFTHVSVIEAAVGAAASTAKLELGVGSATHRLGGGAGIEVPVVSLDEWRRRTGAPPPDVIMIDIEGAEIEALKGMRATIMEFLPAIMVEVHWLGESFVQYVQSELAPLGYCAVTYAGDPLPGGIARYHALLTTPR
jgi:FkbM family methyltransferase